MQGLMAKPTPRAWALEKFGFVPTEADTHSNAALLRQAARNVDHAVSMKKLEWFMHGRQRGQYEALNMQACTPRKNCNVRRKPGRVA